MNDKVPSSYIELTAGIVSAYVSNNAVAAGDISSLISQVHTALLRISNGQNETPADSLGSNRRATVNHAVDRVVMLVLRRTGSLMGTARRCQEASGPRDEGLIWSV